VPYREEHVLTYNRWLQDDEILELTCSEKLTLEEEYQNQKDCENSRQSVFSCPIESIGSLLEFVFIILDVSLNSSMIPFFLPSVVVAFLTF
jgi:hypothetical protein